MKDKGTRSSKEGVLSPQVKDLPPWHARPQGMGLRSLRSHCTVRVGLREATAFRSWRRSSVDHFELAKGLKVHYIGYLRNTQVKI